MQAKIVANLSADFDPFAPSANEIGQIVHLLMYRSINQVHGQYWVHFNNGHKGWVSSYHIRKVDGSQFHWDDIKNIAQLNN